MSANILIVEDEVAILELIALNLHQSGFNPLRAVSAEIADNLVKNTLPDLVVLDWMLPGIDGVSFAKRLRTNSDTRKIPIIMLTAKSEEENKILSLNSGIDDYLTKPFSPKELIARIKALLRRSAPELTDEPIKILDLNLDPLQHQLTIKEKLIKIGPTEFKILHLFLKNLNKVFSRNQIMDKIWGNKSEIDDRTVDVHIKRLRACLAPNGYDKIVITIRGEGYSVSERNVI
tara:strand:+ start:45 stop:740 length:696 start_codon:yes stop_codon:yes gene_type:complete